MKQLFLFIALFFAVFADAQTDNVSNRDNALKIYLDCSFCDITYIREELNFVNYVRDTKEAEVHILVTRQSAGNGGKEYTFTFLGQGKFAGKNDTLIYSSQADNTEDEIRAEQIKLLKLGLMYYAAHSANARQINISYKSTAEKDEIVEDKWKSWLFNIGTNAYFNGDSNYKTLYSYSDISINKVTNEKKIEFSLNENYNESNYEFGDETYTSINKSASLQHLMVWSLNEHWSAGYSAEIGNSTFNNLEFTGSAYPAIEYNLFPYSESTRHQLRFLFRSGYVYNFYTDTTIYNKTEEGLFKERLSIAYETAQKWGSVNTSLTGSLYLHDFSKNNLRLYTSLNIRIVKGLSLRLSSSVSLIHDQLYLPLEGASRDEILLRQEQLSTQYSYWGSVGLNYTFGSIYNNIVNPRFGN